MRIFVLLSHYIILNVVLGGVLFYLSQVYSDLSTKNESLNTEFNTLESTIASNQVKIKTLQNLKKEFEAYLNSNEFRPSIKNFKEFILLSKKIDDFKELNQMNFTYKFGKKQKAVKEKYFYQLTLNTEYSNIKEINKLLVYIKDMYKTKLINIDYKGSKMTFELEILSDKF